MKKLLHFILYSNIFIAFCAVAMANASLLLLQKEHSFLIDSILFFGTLSTYNLCSFYQLEAYSEKFSFIKKNKYLIRVFFGISVLFLGGVLFWINLNQLIFLFHLAIISVFYTVPVHLRTKAKTILYLPAWRNIPFLKVFLIAYVWASATVVFPALDKELIITNQIVILLFLERFLFILAITLPFDIRDYHLDKKTNLLTFATWKTTYFAKILSIFFALLAISISFYTYSFLGLRQSSTVLTYFFLLILLILSNEKRPEWFFTALIDGTMLLPFFLLFFSLSTKT